MSGFGGSFAWGYGGFGGGMGFGYGMPGATESLAPMVSDDKKATPKDAVERRWANGPWMSGPGYLPGFDKAPPLSIPILWQMRRYTVIRLAFAIAIEPIMASPRTIEIMEEFKDDDDAKKMQELATAQVLPFIEKAMLPGFESLQFGWSLQEIIWDRKDGYTYPREPRAILPGEAVMFRDAYRQFSGYQFGNEFRDPRYALLTVNNPHIDPIFGEARNSWCREEWWRLRQSEENADTTERKAAGRQMTIGIPQGATFTDEHGKQQGFNHYAQRLINSATRGEILSYPLCYFDQDAIERDPKLADIPALKIDQLDWGNIGPAIAAHQERKKALQADVMMAWMRPTREAMEGSTGTKAEAGTHGAIGTTDSEAVAAQQLGQINKQVLDRWIVTNFGTGKEGMVYCKQAPLSDPQQEFLQKVFIGLATGQTPDPKALAQIDQRALALRVEMPVVDEDEAEQNLAEAEQKQKDQEDAKNQAAIAVKTAGQANGNPPQNGNGSAPVNGKKPRMALSASVAERLAGYLELEDEDPVATLSLEAGGQTEALVGGDWRTINGAHVYIRDGVAIAGPKHLVGKTTEGIESHGKASPDSKPGYHAIERNAKGDYLGTKQEDGSIKHVQEHADRLQKTKAQPGHTDVFLSHDLDADAPVVGTDSAGRTQAPRSEAASKRAKAEKFSRNDEFHKALPAIRARLEADLGGKNAEEAAVLSLIDKTGFRIGGDEDTGAKVQAYGASTLNSSHVTIDGDKVRFQFIAKKGVAQDHTIEDPKLAALLAPRVAKGGNLFNTNDSKSGAYLKSIAGNDSFKNKDFRTEVGTETARQNIAKMPVPATMKELKAARKTVSEATAAKLGNNPSEALKSYINPKVFKQWNATVANREQAQLIAKHAAATGLSENTAAGDWIAKGHAAKYREQFNKAIGE